MRFLALTSLLLAAVPAQAATLRQMVTLHGPYVYLRDLFDDAGRHADRMLGPGPGPGGRIIVASAQLGAIARQFGVDWRPASAADRSVLEWPGRPMRREDALAATRTALIAAGAAPDCVIAMAGFTPPTVPLDSTPRPEVVQLDYNSATGRFTAVLSVTAEGMDPITTRIGGQVDETVELPVPTMRIAAGAVLRARDIHMGRVSVSQVRGEVVRTPQDAIGLQTKRQILPGQPLMVSDLMRPAVVQRGEPVRMTLETGGLSLVGQGIAMDSGATGERIHVRNPTSRAILEAEVIGPRHVRVSPNVAPVSVESRRAMLAGRP